MNAIIKLSLKKRRMKMHVPTYKQFTNLRSLATRNTQADLMVKAEDSFLEKFFVYNISDYFHGYVENLLEQKMHEPKMNLNDKKVFPFLFKTKNSFSIEQFTQKINHFYQEKSKSISTFQFPYAFKLCYAGKDQQDPIIKSNELIFMKVKVKADVEKIQAFPQKIQALFSPYRLKGKVQRTQCELELKKYQGKYLNIFIVYFGDSNFGLFNEKKYQQKTIRIMNKQVTIRYFVFYISRQALIQSFTSMNKIASLEYINDIMAQFYELKRKKKRIKRLSTLKQKKRTESIFKRYSFYQALRGVSIIIFVFMITKTIF